MGNRDKLWEGRGELEITNASETLERVPETYLKPIKTKNRLYEARVQLASNIWRVFCFFDEGKLVILLNGFQKKTKIAPPKEIEKAAKLMDEYYAEKEVQKGKKKKRSIRRAGKISKMKYTVPKELTAGMNWTGILSHLRLGCF
jgi:phage-related protein